MTEIMGLHFITGRMFYAVQSHYVCPEVEATFTSVLTQNTEAVKDKNVVLCG